MIGGKALKMAVRSPEPCRFHQSETIAQRDNARINNIVKVVCAV